MIPTEIPVVSEFMDVFEDFFGILIDRDMEFSIDIILGTVPITVSNESNRATKK